jgi:uncharacterized protein
MNTAMTAAEVDAFADRVFAAIEAGDVDAVASMWADDIAVWHNTDQVEQSKAANLRTLDWMVANTVARSYRAIRRTALPDGFVQQHVLHLEFDDGRGVDLPAALFVRIAEGRVTRIDEYLDGAAIAHIFA